MDRLESLGSTLSQITMYDIKSMYNQAKNVVLNVSEMEAKVIEATNDEPWGASSTLMQEIAQRTFSYQYFNEIMPSIYTRFMEKEARQWRQIYKALQLLEYLIKHGSERVVDDARSHISTIKMLRNFHYIDDKGKDEGMNVRNRSRELVELLSDVDKIRQERRKAKANKHKYIGTGNDGMGMGFSGGDGRYGGFGNDSFGGGGGDYGNGSYGSGGAGSSSNFSGGGGSFRDDNRRGAFEEYNAGDDEVIPSPTRAGLSHSNSLRSQTRSGGKAREAAPAAAPVVQEVNLLDGFGDDDPFSVGGTTTGGNGMGLATDKALPAVASVGSPSVGLDTDDDDFTDFQAAPVQPAIPTTANTTSAKPSLMEMLSSTPPRPVGTTTTNSGLAQPTIQPQPAGFGMGMGMGMHRPSQSLSQQTYASSPPQQQQNIFGGAAPLKPTSTLVPNHPRPASNIATNTNTTTPTKAAGGSANFDDLWTMSLGGSGSKPAGGAGTGKSIKDLEREKAMAGLWGGGTGPGQKPSGMGAAMGGAGAGTFGSFGSMGSTTAGSGGTSGGDDLLL